MRNKAGMSIPVARSMPFRRPALMINPVTPRNSVYDSNMRNGLASKPPKRVCAPDESIPENPPVSDTNT